MSKAQSAEIPILSTSPFQDDHGALEAIFLWHSGAKPNWKLHTSATLQAATALLRTGQIPVLISECDLRPGSWKEPLEEMAGTPHSPALIVTPRLADERLWVEVLNLGGWDVLVKPFERTEVIRVVESAWRHWQNRQQSPARAHEAWVTASAGL